MNIRNQWNSYVLVAKDVEIKFDASIYELDRPLTKVKNKKLTEILKDEIGRKIITEFAAFDRKHMFI